MVASPSGRYLLTVRIGRKQVHGLHIYNRDDAMTAKQRLIGVGVKAVNIQIDSYESIFEA